MDLYGLKSMLAEHAPLASVARRIDIFEERLVFVDFSLLSGLAAIDVHPFEHSVELSVVGRDQSIARTLRSCLLTSAEVVQFGGERIRLSTVELDSCAEAIGDVVLEWIERIRVLVDESISDSPVSSVAQRPTMSCFWWDHISNFGDGIGPLLVSNMLNVEPANVRGRSTSRSTLYSVGSVISMIDRDNVLVWGSGLLKPLTDTQIMSLRGRKNVEVLAVRGEYTSLELRAKVGWSVPAVYGDPALLLPRYFRWDESCNSDSVSLILHWEHLAYLKGRQLPGVEVIDVRDSVQSVVKRIAGSRVCVSSSLHGIIVAQAYGVPWVWLQVGDHRLHSSDFKFDDFFSTLDRPKVTKVVRQVRELPEVDWLKVADRASLPYLHADLDALERSVSSRFLNRL